MINKILPPLFSPFVMILDADMAGTFCCGTNYVFVTSRLGAITLCFFHRSIPLIVGLLILTLLSMTYAIIILLFVYLVQTAVFFKNTLFPVLIIKNYEKTRVQTKTHLISIENRIIEFTCNNKKGVYLVCLGDNSGDLVKIQELKEFTLQLPKRPFYFGCHAETGYLVKFYARYPNIN